MKTLCVLMLNLKTEKKLSVCVLFSCGKKEITSPFVVLDSTWTKEYLVAGR